MQRVLKPGGKFILSQSNRMFPTKAIAMWLGMDDLQHCLVIGAYFNYAGGWTHANAFNISPQAPLAPLELPPDLIGIRSP